MGIILCLIGGVLLGHGVARVPSKLMFGLDVYGLDYVISVLALFGGAYLIYLGFAS